jgi:hypothetical protein
MTSAPLAHTDVVVLDYLAALWAQSDDLSPELRDELMSTVADYIAVRRSSPADPLDDAAEIVRRLGPPEALVAAARRGAIPPHLRLPALIPPPPPAPMSRPRAHGEAGGVEYTALGLLTVGGLVLPVISPLAGLLLVTGSPHWSPAQKAAAWMVTAGAGAAAAALVVFFAAAGVTSDLVIVIIYMALCAGSMIAGVGLYTALRPRPA